MNSFKRELLLLLRNRLFLVIYPVFTLFLSLWHFVVMNIYKLYSIMPLMFCFFIPLMTYGLWSRERALGLIGTILNSRISIYRVVMEKVLISVVFSLVLLLLPIPFIISHHIWGNIDIGRIVSINIWLILYILLFSSMGFMLSVILRGRILIYLLSVVLLLFLVLNRGYGINFVDRFFGFLSISKIIQPLFNGVLGISGLVIIISISSFFIFISKSVIVGKTDLKLLAVLIALSVTLPNIPLKLDITARRSYTLNNESRELLAKGSVPVHISYYYTEELEQRSPIINEIKSILDSMAKDPNLTLRYINNKEPAFIKAVKSFNPIPIDDVGNFYSFIIIEYLSNYKMLPLLSVVETLEFDILRNIDDLYRGQRLAVGIMPGNENFTEDSFSALNTLLNNYFDTSFIFPGDKFPESIDILIVAGLYNINYETLSRIGDFLSDGGDILIAGTGLPTNEALEYRQVPVLDSLKFLGVNIEAFLIADENNVGLKDESGRITPYPLNVVTRAALEVEGDPIVSPFPGFNGLYLSPVLTEDNRFKTLLTSSNRSWLVNKSTGIDGTPEGSYPVALYGEGSFASSFSGNDVGNINRMLVLGNSLSLTNLSYTMGVDAGYEFILRSLYKLSGNDNLLNSMVKLRSFTPYSGFSYPVDRKLNILNSLFVFVLPSLLLLICFRIRRRFL